MNCSKCQDLLWDYMEGLLPDADKATANQHIQSCPTCQATLEEMQGLQTRLHHAGQMTRNSVMATQVMESIAQQREKPTTPQSTASSSLWSRALRSPLLKLTAAIIVVFLSPLVVRLWNGTQGIAMANVFSRLARKACMCDIYLSTTRKIGNTEESSPNDVPQAPDNLQTLQCFLLFNEDLPEKSCFITLDPDDKTYEILFEDDTSLLVTNNQTLFDELSECDFTSIGRSQVEGIEVEGFESVHPLESLSSRFTHTRLTFWIDCATELPVQLEFSADWPQSSTGITLTLKAQMTHFNWDLPTDLEALKALIPDDYRPKNNSPSTLTPTVKQRQITEALKTYADCFGHYPKSLGIESFMEPLNQLRRNQTEAMSAEIKKQRINDLSQSMQILINAQTKLSRYQKDPAYYGDRVTPDMPDHILMRWTISENQYRVIFGDLSVKTLTANQLANLEQYLDQKGPS